jgi:hypothetical protein
VADHAHHTRRPAGLGHEARPGGRPPLIGDSRVAVLIKVAYPPAFNALLQRLRADGLHVTRTLAAYGLAEGTLPIDELPAAAQDSARMWLAPRRILR